MGILKSRQPRRHIAPILLALSQFGLATSCSEGEQPPGPTLHAPKREAEPEPAPTQSKRPSRRGDQATYTILRGGTLINVANLYKLYPHEIIALNPDIDPKQELAPKTEVVVYQDRGTDSESIGLPHDGRLVGAMPMLDGPGRRITAERWKTWATRDTVMSLDKVLRLWADKYPKAPVVLIGNLSAREGGPLSPHKTHQSGRDVDLSYIQKWDGQSRVSWQRMNAQNLDAKRTWQLLRLLVKQSDIKVIFMDRKLQRLLARYAKRHRLMPAAKLSHWLQVAGDSDEQALVRHVPGHRDHMHVRFACPTSQRRCRD